MTKKFKYISRPYLKRISREHISEMEKSASKILLEGEIPIFARSKQYIFICHSSLDKGDALEVASMFRMYGYDTYIDWLDQGLPAREQVSATTAGILKENIQNASGLVYVASENSPDSVWMPWELGMSDGLELPTAVMPLVEEEGGRFDMGREYIGLYPRIVRIENSAFVFNHTSHKMIPLPLWLSHPGRTLMAP